MAADESESDFDIDIDADDLIPGMGDPADGGHATLKATKLMLGFEDGSSSGSSSEDEASKAAPAVPELGLLAAASAASASAAASAAASREVPAAVAEVALDTSIAAPAREIGFAPPTSKAETALVEQKHSVEAAAPSAATTVAASNETSRESDAALPRGAALLGAGVVSPAPAATGSASREEWDDIARQNEVTPQNEVAVVSDSFDLEKEGEETAPKTDELTENSGEAQGVVAAKQDLLSTPISYSYREVAAPSAAITVAASNETSRESDAALPRGAAPLGAGVVSAGPAATGSASREEWDDIARQNEVTPQNEVAVESDSSDLEKEWEEIAQKTEELAKNAREAQGVVAAKQDLLSTPISYKEVTQWLLQVEINKEALLEFRETVEDEGALPCGCFKRSRPRSDVPGLDKKLWAEKDLVLFLKVTHFDFNDTVHHRMLRTVYGKLSRNKVCPTIGRHWEVLGFQGGDPRTDLNRSGGLLNVLQIFYFFSHHFDLLKAAYLLAQDVQQNYPLACVSINITKMVIEALLSGKLSKLCNSGSKGVFDTCCQMHSAALYHFYWRWRTQKRSIEHTELTFNEVRALLFKRPAKLLEMLDQGIAESKAKSDPSRLEFTELDFGAARPKAKATASLPTRLWQYQARE